MTWSSCLALATPYNFQLKWLWITSCTRSDCTQQKMYSIIQQLNLGDAQTLLQETEASQAPWTWTYPRLYYQVGKHSTQVREDSGVVICNRSSFNGEPFIPNSEEWDIIDGLISTLEPFQKATEAMTGEKYSTISTVKLLVLKLLSK